MSPRIGVQFTSTVKFDANWKYIQERKQRLIDENNRQENSTRISPSLPCRRQGALPGRNKVQVQ
jgi:hypothetical protein